MPRVKLHALHKVCGESLAPCLIYGAWRKATQRQPRRELGRVVAVYHAVAGVEVVSYRIASPKIVLQACECGWLAAHEVDGGLQKTRIDNFNASG